MSDELIFTFGNVEELSFSFDGHADLDFKLDTPYVDGGVKKYPQLQELPQINGVTLVGNMTSKELKLQDEMDALSVTDLEKILYLG